MTIPRRRHSLLALGLSVLLVAGATTTVFVAQAPAPPPPADQGGFDFPEEEEDAPTWAEDIRAQAVDIALVAGFSVLFEALNSSRRLTSRGHGSRSIFATAP